ncbi:MAG: isoprenyl transferase [Nitrospirales bacterium]|nr:isoprenyl transferase [Nitrospira sp.]MDR4501956.1 isoprenyl transferase [Nitrospirales bacterium]
MSHYQVAPPPQVIEAELLSQLELSLLPRHVAIIMDGNGRWAALRGLPRIEGHREGLSALRDVLDVCHEIGIPHVTIYAFSHENWNRPAHEVSLLMRLLNDYLTEERQIFHERQVRFFPIGRLEKLPKSVYHLVQNVAEETQHFTDRVLTVALSYGGRAEIIDAVKNLVHDIQAGSIRPQDIQEDLFERYLTTHGLPDPDLLIRTSGETRISNFLPWQIAYTELYFTKTLWPDFRRQELLTALLDYQSRERRFGRVPHTVSPQNGL